MAADDYGLLAFVVRDCQTQFGVRTSLRTYEGSRHANEGGVQQSTQDCLTGPSYGLQDTVSAHCGDSDDKVTRNGLVSLSSSSARPVHWHLFFRLYGPRCFNRTTIRNDLPQNWTAQSASIESLFSTRKRVYFALATSSSHSVHRFRVSA